MSRTLDRMVWSTYAVKIKLAFAFVSSDRSSYSDDGLLYINSRQRPLFQIFTQSIDAIDATSVTLRERCQKNKEKKITSVSFAFTHTYTPVKTNIFPFFPQAYMENFEKCANPETKTKNILFHVTCGC